MLPLNRLHHWASTIAAFAFIVAILFGAFGKGKSAIHPDPMSDRQVAVADHTDSAASATGIQFVRFSR